MKKHSLPWLYAIVFLTATGYGISFPLLSISLEQMEVSGQLIGVNAAMPALGWLLGTWFLPLLQRALGLRLVLLGLLAIVMLALLGFALTRDFWTWTALRLLFGGGLGLFYRAVEFWINGISRNDVRGRNIGLYATCFVLGLVLGSAVQPQLGTQGFWPYGGIMVLLSGAFVLVALTSFEQLPEIDRQAGYRKATVSLALVFATPIAFVAIFAYGLFEDIGAYLLSVYALRNQFGEDVAAYTLTAIALGNLLFALPIGLLSDRMSRTNLLIICALMATILSALVPMMISDSTVFLLTLVVLGGFTGALYTLSLAIIGDHHQGHDLAVANAGFGLVYALGALVGPLVNGAAMDTLDSHGLMVSSTIIVAILAILSLFLRRLQSRREA